ncbi:MAG TPA: hypothetical protein VIL24_05250 [Clostridia bacterium]
MEEKYDDATGRYVFKNCANSFNVSFEKEINSNKLMTLSKDNYKVEIELLDQLNNSAISNKRLLHIRKGLRANVSNSNNKEIKFTNRFDKADIIQKPLKLKSKIRYDKIFDNIDFEYVLLPDGLKENIIIHQKSQEYEFIFKIKLENLNIRLSEEKTSLELYSPKDEQVVFEIPKPFMLEADNNRSDDIYYRLIESDKPNVYYFSIIPNNEWINDNNRKFPVVIDPQIKLIKYNNFLSVGNNNSTYNVFSAGKYPDATQRYLRGLIKFDSLISETVLAAYLYILQDNEFSDYTDEYFTLSPIKSSWSSGTSFVWNSNPQTENVYTMFKMKPFNSQPLQPIELDITNIYRYWQRTGTNYGLMLKRLTETNSAGYLSVYINGQEELMPQLVVIYKTNKMFGIKEASLQNSIFDNGTATVNLFTGNLNFVNNDISIDDTIPINVCHVYNTFSINDNSSYGKGWRLNLFNSLKSVYDENDAGKISYYVYTNSNGEEILLTKKYTYDNEWLVTEKQIEDHNLDVVEEISDEFNLELKYIPGSNTLTDKQGKKIIFNSSGNIQKIITKQNQEIVFNNLSVTYPNGNKVELVQNGSQKVIEIKYANISVQCLYDGQYLTKIVTNKGETEFSYNNSGYLKSIKNQTGYTFEYTYIGTKVHTITEKTKTTKINAWVLPKRRTI